MGERAEAWPAPGKLNLFLHVVGRRPGGYHDLQTAFQFIDRCDWLRFEVSPYGPIEHVGLPSGVSPESELALRAAQALRVHAGVGHGARIAIDKRLPAGSGLGGGSSDAATTLVALNRLWETGLGIDDLAELALELGADVPVFVRGRAAWGEGVGDRLTPIEPAEPWYVILDPHVTVRTAEVFADPSLTRDHPPITISDFLAGRTGNDCEAVVRARHPEVEAVIEWLGQYAPARMTGTGSCVFAPMDSETRAREVLEAVPDAWRGFVTRGRNRSPLLDGPRAPDPDRD